ncbi:MAG: anti-sigma F factor [Clostridiaceae bacterium]|jgi:stage II sporulation protein AB (anti-sigma F factor)|nr:anti-sigma F factor [Clostridiaceae bacterium]
MKNYLKLTFPALSENESFARNAVAAFAVRANPTVEETEDLKTAVSEAVTNAVVHAYPQKDFDAPPEIHIEADLCGNALTVTVRDEGVGIADVEAALQPFFTTKEDDERSGMGFTLMQSFTDGLTVTSAPGAGTAVRMIKFIGAKNA